MNLKLFSTMFTSIVLSSSILPALAGEYQFRTWVNQDVLATDHKAYCDDVIGQQVRNNTGSINQNDIGSQGYASNRSSMQEYSNSKQSGTQAGVGLGPIGFKFGQQSSNSNSGRTANTSANQSNNSWDRSSQRTFDRSTVTSESVGKNCSAFVQSGAMVEATQINAETDRMGMRTQERMGMFNMLFGGRKR